MRTRPRTSRTNGFARPSASAQTSVSRWSGTLLGKAHQRFEDLKAAITGRDEKAVINEVERGEDYLKAKFETALEGGSLTDESRMVVERAYQSVRAGHDQMSQLKHGMESNA